MKSRPKALDLFCGAGGVSVGLNRAGFHVVGVDNRPQPHYPFADFMLGDAMKMDLSGFDLLWASPPCQAFTSLRWMYNAKSHPDLIGQIRKRFQASGIPYAIENVPAAPLKNPLLLCGSMFELGTDKAELRRHRLFECSFEVAQPKCQHGRKDRVIGVYGGHGRDRRRKFNGQDFSTAERRQAMGIDWMNGQALSQAIPPAYAEYIGRAALSLLQQDCNGRAGFGHKKSIDFV